MDITTNQNSGSNINSDWSSCKNILVIRADNLGDLIMSSPAIRALKQTFGAKITVLTSQMATGIAKHIREIDEVITYDLPWVKTNNAIAADSFFDIVSVIKQKQFDAAVIFTVFSQNPLPAAMLAYLANISKRLAYCRENPYDLLTDWVPDKEPYDFIKHQVERDLELVATIGATTSDDRLSLNISEEAYPAAQTKMKEAGVDLSKPWLICHAPVSEAKRLFPIDIWIEVGKKLVVGGYQLLFTGTKNEKQLTDQVASGVGNRAFSVAGLFSLEEFIAVIKHTPLVVTVNTGTVHIAAAVGTPTVVLYAATNPQHSPWKVPSKVLLYEVKEEMRSKNEVIQFLYREVYKGPISTPTADEIVIACFELLEKPQEEGKAITQTLTPVTD
jgi:ADP-heptose:LPS heptosyltransferase